MNIVEQDNHDLKKLSELIKDERFCMLTNLDDSGNLVSRPMTPVEMTGNGTIWFLIKFQLVQTILILLMQLFQMSQMALMCLFQVAAKFQKISNAFGNCGPP